MGPSFVQKVEAIVLAALEKSAGDVSEKAVEYINGQLDSLESKLKSYIDEKITAEVAKLSHLTNSQGS